MASSSERKPNDANPSRTSAATNNRYAATPSGVPANLARRWGRWVAMPVEQVSRWQARSMMQPSAIIAAVPKLNSSAPSRAAISTSRPVMNPPSTRTRTRSRKPFSINERWVSARPSSHGMPACLMEERGEAPVPPLLPLIWTTSANALTTPAAMVPTPSDATNFTLTSAKALTCFRSKISWARSSIE